MRTAISRSLFALACLACAAAGVAADLVVTYPVAADTDLDVRIPNSPNGAAYRLVVEEGYYKGGMTTDRALVRFDIDAPADLIAQATLRLGSDGVWGDGGVTEIDLALHVVLNAWSEPEATWWWRFGGDSPVFWDDFLDGTPSYGPGGGDFDPEPVAVFTVRDADDGSFVDVDITGIVRDWQSGALENHGLLIKVLVETQEPGDGTLRKGADFISRENSIYPERAPRLDVRLHIPGDLNGDNVVNQQDLGILLASYDVDDGGDINGDGLTNQQDLGILLANYERTLP
jgi:hypothetical protein